MPAELAIESISRKELDGCLIPGSDDLRQAEFKPVLPPATDSGCEEFLGDIASFANAAGGHILYGASRGSEPSGLEEHAMQNALAWMQTCAQSGIAPRIPGLRFQAIKLRDSRCLLAVRIPKTGTGPHMVTYRNSNRFFTRNASGRCLLDVAGLRSAFALTDSCMEKIRAFRLERMNAILNHALTVRLSDAPKAVLHILPVASFQPGFRADLGRIESGEVPLPRPMEARGVLTHHNFDGLITFSSVEKFAYSYVQVFRNGCVEATDALLLEPRGGRKNFPGAAFEKEIIQCGEGLLRFLRDLEIDPPYAVMASFLGVRGYGMFAGPMRWHEQAHPIERDQLFVEEVVLNDFEDDFARVMRPVFDQVWNACGWPRSINYDQAGNWREAHGR